MDKKKEKKERDRIKLWDDWNGEYVGNIWGWKFSYFGLGLLLFMLLFCYLRYQSLEVKPDNIFIPVDKVKEQPVEETKTDTKTKEQ